MQKVVRTATCDSGYWCQGERISDLQNLLKQGYKVVMCNKISNGKMEWLEYIVEKKD